MPEELRRREGRLEKIREAKERLEERARRREQERAEARGAEAVAAARAVPRPKEQSNFTGPGSRTMKSSP